MRILDGATIDRQQHVARTDAGAIGRAAADDAGDERAFSIGQAEGFGEFGVISCASTPIQPRTTEPFCRICSMMLRALEIGMAKPMPWLPPVRE